MSYVKTLYDYSAYERLPVSSAQTFPSRPFPRKYVHSVLDDLNYVVQAVYALRDAGCRAEDIHVMASWDFVAAVERRHQQQNLFSKAFTRLLTFFDEGFGDAYLHEACRGHHILAVHLSGDMQIKLVHDVLASYYAHLIKYVDTWTVTDLAPAPSRLD